MDNLLNLTKALERPLNFPCFRFGKLKFAMRYNSIVSIYIRICIADQVHVLGCDDGEGGGSGLSYASRCHP